MEDERTSHTTSIFSVVDRTTQTSSERILEHSPGSTREDQVPWKTRRTSHTALPSSVVDRTTKTSCQKILEHSLGSTEGPNAMVFRIVTHK